MRRASGRGSRLKSIRLRMLAIVLIPSAALLIIGVGASGYLVYQGYTAQDWATTMQATVAPGTKLAALAEEERRLSLLRLGGDTSAGPALEEQRTALDTHLASLESLNTDLIKLNPDAVGETIAASAEVFGRLPEIRQRVDSGQARAMDVYEYYNEAVEIVKQGLQGVAETAPDPVTAVEESTAVTLYDIADAMSRGHALAVGGVTRGGLTVEEYQEFARQVGRYHTELDSVLPTLTESLRDGYARLAATAEWQRLSEMEDALLLRGPLQSPAEQGVLDLPMTVAAWQDATSQVNDRLLELYSEHHHYAEGFAADTGRQTFVNSLIGGGAVLLVTIAAALVAIRLSNRVVNRMKRLREETLELADTRLPQLVDRLRGGEQIDIETEVPPLRYGVDELGQVAEAFNKAQHTAVAAAAQEAKTQNGVKAVFLNIAHRSQIVVRRQLEVLDKAEREQEDPDHLESLFQLDHLATRARRNAENLIILGGERPGRQWRNPVPLMEIVRSAISETEHYRRVHIARLPDVSISGAVVADLVHLLAELVDNATAFSPPDSRVEVRGNTVGKGVVVEVEDQGLGIPPDEREQINADLQNPPDFGVMALSEEARLGLFVVSQLAARHGISVTLVDSVYGGIRAIVLIRSAIIATGSGNGTGRGGRAAEERSEVPVPRRERSWLLDAEQSATVPAQARGAVRDDQAEPGADRPATTVDDGASTPEPVGRDDQVDGTVPDASSAGNGHADDTRSSVDPRPPLPRRRRQANLAPQLTNETPTPAEQGVADDADAIQSAERARNRMTAFQRGTREGREAT